jgi:hypothetical protein
MSMRGEVISKDYQGMVFVHDNNGRDLSDNERKKCTDISLVLGVSW